MPRTDVEAVRRFFGAWTGGDVPAMLEVAHADIVARPLLGMLYRRSEYRGHSGIRQWVKESAALGDRFEVHVEDTSPAGGGLAAFLHIVVHEGEASFDARVAMMCLFRDGRIVSLVGRDVDETREALARAAQHHRA
jgi:ketosteroid isomerase-like protein